MSKKTRGPGVEVIVTNCMGSGIHVRTYGPELIRRDFDSEPEALKIGCGQAGIMMWEDVKDLISQVLEHEERKVESALAL